MLLLHVTSISYHVPFVYAHKSGKSCSSVSSYPMMLSPE